MVNLDPRARENIQKLLESSESILSLSLWSTVLPDMGWDFWGDTFKTNQEKELAKAQRHAVPNYVIVVTNERLYFVAMWVFFGRPPKKVHSSWSRVYGDFTQWNFLKLKNKKGELKHYSFVFAGNDGQPNLTLYAAPDEADLLIPHFSQAMARVEAVQGTSDVAAQLSAMHALWSEGVLSDEEFQRSKELFLGTTPDQQQRAEQALRSLKQLLDAGVLSASEFRTKKWQILSGG